MYDNTRAHFSIVYILVLFAVITVCACTLGGEQRNLSTRQLPNTNVHGDLEVSGELEVSGIFRDTYSIESAGFVDIPVGVGETTVLTVKQPRHTYIDAVGVTYGGTFTAATGTLTLNIKEGSTTIAGTTGNLIGGAGDSTSANVERPLFYVNDVAFKRPVSLQAATAAALGDSSAPEATATATNIRNTGGERELVISAAVETGVLTASSSIRVAIRFAHLRVL